MQLTSFTAAYMVLCFAFMAKTVLTTHQWFSYCSTVLAQHEAILTCCCPKQVGWEWSRGWEGTQLGQLTSSGQRDIPCHMTLCSAIKAQRKEEKGMTLIVMTLVFPSNHYVC